jgi:Flp pilus assembly protein TadG
MANLTTEISRNLSLRQRRDGNWKAFGSARREDAQSLVELALVVPLFILLLVGSAELARVAWAAVLTSNAARAGAAWGAVDPANAGDASGGIEAAAAADGVNLTGLTTAPPSVSCVCSNGNAIGNCFKTAVSDCPSPATITDYVQVNTSSTVTPLMHYPGLPRTFTVTGQSIMVVAP